MTPIGNPMIFRHYSLEEALKKMATFGYREIELWLPQIEMCRTDELRRQLVVYAKSLELSLVRLSTAGADYFVPLDSRHDTPGIIAGLKRDIDIAHSMGMTQLLTWEGRKPDGANSGDIHGWLLDETTRIFRETVAYGEPRGVSLSVEPHPFTLGMDLDFLVKLCDAVDSEFFGVTYDCCHFGVGLSQDYLQAIPKLGGRIKHVHFSDSDQRSSQLHFSVGKGCLDLAGIVAALKQIEFKGTVMLDLWLYPFPEQGTRESLPYVGNVIETLGIKQ